MKSVWQQSCEIGKRESLDRDIKCDVLVVGAGIAGILTAYLLKKQGIDVVVIEAKEIGSGNTSGTTAKITSQHDLIYDTLISELGEKKAKQYADANQLAIKKYKEIIEEKNIECDFEEKPAYLYTLGDVEALYLEGKAAAKLGIECEFVKEIDLPFEINLALKFNNQAQFNPLKFIKRLAEELIIYEHTTALEVKEDLVLTNRGKIKANSIVIATHFPIINVPGYYFARMHQERSYIIALENTQDIDGMYIDIGDNGYSFRNYENLLLLVGGNHRTGKKEESSYEILRGIGRKLFPKSKEKYCWSAQDCMTLDKIPYIGKYSSEESNIYVTTGFNKWGMTSSMVSAMILADMIMVKENDFKEVFSPKRLDISMSISDFLENGVEVTKGLLGEVAHIPKEHIESIEKGHGGIVEYNNEKVGIYKNKEGKIFVVTTKCPHLGCELQWNSDELSWDCPCHGSRFDYRGKWLDSPAIGGLCHE